jgi:hypothetical protein
VREEDLDEAVQEVVDLKDGEDGGSDGEPEPASELGWKGTAHFALIKAYRGQLWKGKQNKKFERENDENRDGTKLFIIIKFQKHLVIVNMGSFCNLCHLLLTKIGVQNFSWHHLC